MPDLNDPSVRIQYELLNILDAKSSGVLTFNAIFLTAISVWLGYVPPNWLHLILDGVFMAQLISCVLLLSVLWLRWSLPIDPDAVRIARTGRYRIAFVLSSLSVVVVLGVTLIHTVGTALKASDRCGQRCEAFYSEAVFGNLDRR